MITKCPKCGKKSQVDESKIPEKGAKVRCPSCQVSFVLKKTAPVVQTDNKGDTSDSPPPDGSKILNKIKGKCPKCLIERSPGSKTCPECGTDYKKYEAFLVQKEIEEEKARIAKADEKQAAKKKAEEQAKLEAKQLKEKKRESVLLDTLVLSSEDLQDELMQSSEFIDFVSLKKAGSSSDDKAVIPVINGPDIDYLSILDEETFLDGDPIVVQGKHGNWIWVLLEGIIEIRKVTSQGQQPLLRIGAGSFIGSIAALIGESKVVRSASVFAKGNVQLGILDSQSLVSEYNALSDEFKKILLSLDKRIKDTTAKAVASGQEMKKMMKAAVHGKKLLIKQGGKPKGISLIEQGSAIIIRKTDRGIVLLGEYGKDDFVGSISFLNHGQEPAFASVYVSENFEAEQIDTDLLEGEYDRLSITFKNMIENFSSFVLTTTMMACDHHHIVIKK